MTGRTYYLTTMELWQSNAARFVNSHYVHVDGTAVGDAPPSEAETIPAETHAEHPVQTRKHRRPSWSSWMPTKVRTMISSVPGGCPFRIHFL